MARLLQIFDAALLLPPADVFDNSPLKIADAIFIDILHRLDAHVLIVASAYLHIKRLFSAAVAGLLVHFLPLSKTPRFSRGFVVSQIG